MHAFECCNDPFMVSGLLCVVLCKQLFGIDDELWLFVCT